MKPAFCQRRLRVMNTPRAVLGSGYSAIAWLTVDAAGPPRSEVVGERRGNPRWN